MYCISSEFVELLTSQSCHLSAMVKIIWRSYSPKTLNAANFLRLMFIVLYVPVVALSRMRESKEEKVIEKMG